MEPAHATHVYNVKGRRQKCGQLEGTKDIHIHIQVCVAKVLFLHSLHRQGEEEKTQRYKDREGGEILGRVGRGLGVWGKVCGEGPQAQGQVQQGPRSQSVGGFKMSCLSWQAGQAKGRCVCHTLMVVNRLGGQKGQPDQPAAAAGRRWLWHGGGKTKQCVQGGGGGVCLVEGAGTQCRASSRHTRTHTLNR